MKLNPNQSWGNFLKAAKYYSSTPAKEEYIARSKLGLSDFEIIMCNGDYKKALKILLEKIEKAPAADVVEVVRCADCKYDERCMLQEFVRDERLEPYDKNVFFCADGKRKDGGQDDE